jgi:RNA polymerase sigma-70 factor (ECF subfamily)
MALVAQCRDGNERACRELFEQTKNDVHRILVATVGYDSELDDMLQTAFLEIFRSLNRFKGDSKFTTWMYRLVVNVALQYVRRRRTRPMGQSLDDMVYDPPSPAANPGEHSEQREQVRIVREILDELPAKKRLVFILHDIEGHSPEEIAQIVGVSRFTVKSRLFYARKDFARKLRQRAILESGRTAAAGWTEPDDEEEA